MENRFNGNSSAVMACDIIGFNNGSQDTCTTIPVVSLQNEKDLSSLDCPVGKYCPSPGEQYTCPAGSYCVARTTSPMTCDYSSLLSTSPYTSEGCINI